MKTVIIHVGCNDITPKTYTELKPDVIVNKIIDIGIKCMNYGTKKVFISSILIKKQLSYKNHQSGKRYLKKYMCK